MSALTPARIAELTARMKPVEGEVVMLAFIRQIDGSYLLAAPWGMTWPDILASVSAQRGLIPPHLDKQAS